MSIIPLKQISYKDADDVRRVVDALNANFRYLDWLINSGNIDMKNLSDNVVEAISSGIDVVITDVVLAEALCAEKGTIAELTVDQLDTSGKVRKYLAGDITRDNYIKIFGKRIQFIEAVTDGLSYSPLLDRNDRPIYWVDETCTAITYKETAFPVHIYDYTEYVKLELFFELDATTGYYVPKMVWGVGSGVGDRGKGYIFKNDTGLMLEYKANSGKDYTVVLGENGIEIPYADEVIEYGSAEWNSTGVQFELIHAYDNEPVVTCGISGDAADFSGGVNFIVSHVKEEIQGLQRYSKIIVTPTAASLPSPTGAKITFQAICRGMCEKGV